MTKPFDREVLLARVRVGEQVVVLQTELAERIMELEAALVRVQQLRGLLPICAYCKNIRNDKNYWHEVESYVKSHSEANFRHGICPACWDKVGKPELEEGGHTNPPNTRVSAVRGTKTTSLAKSTLGQTFK
ncbi:hypothetical protein [Gemmata sp.]|uniref:hypothetical protein n=1 Tax=Gemmata sp. TaxID=1914242 RepID=UPI003F72BFFC